MHTPLAGTCFSLRDFDNLGFHDCYVHGFRWEPQPPAFIVELDYIVKWIEDGAKYRFLVAKAELRFDDVTNLKVSLDWNRLPLDCQIDEIVRETLPDTASESPRYLWHIIFSVPCGDIAFESHRFELKILTDPRESTTQYLS